MTRQYQIPGGLGVEESGTRQYQIPGGLGVEETQGGSIQAGAGSAAGTSTAFAVGASIWAGVGSSSGSSTVSGQAPAPSRPLADLVLNGWTRVPAGGSVASALDEDVRDDGDYGVSPAITPTHDNPYRFTLTTPRAAGLWAPKFAARAVTGDAELRVRALDADDNVVGEVIQVVTTTLTLYTLSFTLTGTAVRGELSFAEA